MNRDFGMSVGPTSHAKRSDGWRLLRTSQNKYLKLLKFRQRVYIEVKTISFHFFGTDLTKNNTFFNSWVEGSMARLKGGGTTNFLYNLYVRLLHIKKNVPLKY